MFESLQFDCILSVIAVVLLCFFHCFLRVTAEIIDRNWLVLAPVILILQCVYSLLSSVITVRKYYYSLRLLSVPLEGCSRSWVSDCVNL